MVLQRQIVRESVLDIIRAFFMLEAVIIFLGPVACKQPKLNPVKVATLIHSLTTDSCAIAPDINGVVFGQLQGKVLPL